MIVFFYINEIKTKMMTNNKMNLINIFKTCLDIIRNDEGITGKDALQIITQILTFILIEPRLTNDIKIKDYNYEFNFEASVEELEEYKGKLLNDVYFTNLIKETDIYKFKTNFENVWKDILAQHPKTSNIFTTDNFIKIQKPTTLIKLLEQFNKITIEVIDYDVLGSAYEEVVKNIMTGRDLGQYFTQPIVKKLMIDLINPVVKPDGTIESCCDPTMGTGGFLINYLQEIVKKSKEQNISLNWDYITTEGLFGQEIEPNTFRLALSNMLICSGYLFDKFIRGDSIREPILKKYDNILANPPFGIKGFDYSKFPGNLTKDYIPIKTNSAVSLFLQAIISMLNINGKCAVVLPAGQDLYSKTNNSLISIRMYLMKTCNLQEVIYLPNDIFEYTSIKTCVLFFTKKKEGSEVLNSNKSFKTGTETNTVKFYNYEKEVKTLLIDVPIETIKENSYSLNYIEYVEVEEEEYNEGVEIKTLGEICVFLPKSKRNAKYGLKEGLYPFYTSSQECTKYCNEYDYQDDCLIIGTGGNANIKYDNKFSCSADNLILKSNNLLTTKYIYYYLLNNISVLENGFVGATIKHISKDYVNNLKIPIPSLEKQQEIITHCELSKIKIEYLKQEINNNLQLTKELFNHL